MTTEEIREHIGTAHFDICHAMDELKAIHAGLIDYELACKEAFAMGLEQGRIEQIGEQQR